jgi:hypothetical protein
MGIIMANRRGSKRKQKYIKRNSILDVTSYPEDKLLGLVIASRGILIVIFLILLITLVEATGGF